jgi:hypothetical protein
MIMCKYKKIQCIAYEIYTSKKAKQKSLGTDKEDFHYRWKIFKDTINKALSKCDKSKDTLKVFLVPEFFFRPNEKEMYEDLWIEHCFDIVQRYFKKSKWNNWLICIGSILSMEDYKVKEEKMGFLNATVLYLGGTEKYKIVGKKNTSKVDFSQELKKHKRFNVIEEHTFRTSYEMIHESGKKVDTFEDEIGMKVGVVICLDFSNCVFQENFPYDMNNRVDLLLVPTCGLGIYHDEKKCVYPQSIADCLRAKSIIFNCDGSVPQNTGRPYGSRTIQYYGKPKICWTKIKTEKCLVDDVPTFNNEEVENKKYKTKLVIYKVVSIEKYKQDEKKKEKKTGGSDDYSFINDFDQLLKHHKFL